MDTEIDNEKNLVDNAIITSSIALLSATAVIFTIAKPTNPLLKFTLVFSLFSLAFSFLLSLWHKVRYSKRKKLYDEYYDNLKGKREKEIAEYTSTILEPIVLQKLYNTIDDRKIVDKDGTILYKITEEEINKNTQQKLTETLEEQKYIFERLAESYANEIKSARKKFLESALNEKYSAIKFLIDFFASKTRYLLFTIGIIFFLVSITLKII